MKQYEGIDFYEQRDILVGQIRRGELNINNLLSEPPVMIDAVEELAFRELGDLSGVTEIEKEFQKLMAE